MLIRLVADPHFKYVIGFLFIANFCSDFHAIAMFRRSHFACGHFAFAHAINPMISLRLIQCDKSNVTKFCSKRYHAPLKKISLQERACCTSQCDFITHVRGALVTGD